jgi:alkylated DNA nucleotide flippase Atl1
MLRHVAKPALAGTSNRLRKTDLREGITSPDIASASTAQSLPGVAHDGQYRQHQPDKADADKKRSIGSLKLEWIEALGSDKKISHATLRVAIFIALAVSQGSEEAYISIAALVDKSGVAPRHVRAAINKLRREGWLTWKRTRDANRYTLEFPVRKINEILDRQTILRDRRKEARAKGRKNGCKNGFKIIPSGDHLDIPDSPLRGSPDSPFRGSDSPNDSPYKRDSASKKGILVS